MTNKIVRPHEVNSCFDSGEPVSQPGTGRERFRIAPSVKRAVIPAPAPRIVPASRTNRSTRSFASTSILSVLLTLVRPMWPLQGAHSVRPRKRCPEGGTHAVCLLWGLGTSDDESHRFADGHACARPLQRASRRRRWGPMALGRSVVSEAVELHAGGHECAWPLRRASRRRRWGRTGVATSVVGGAISMHGPCDELRNGGDGRGSQ
jgi:hypothetical protein